MTSAGELSAKFTWEGMQRAMKSFDNYIKAAERATGMSATRMVSNTIKAAAKMEGVFSKSSGRIAKMLQWSARLSGITQAKSELASVEKKALSVGSVLKGLAVGYGVSKGVGVAKGVGGFAMKTGAKFEDLLAGLHTATGSKDSAEKEFSRLAKFAKDTPFGASESVSSFIRLTNLNLDASERNMRAYGDMASAIPGKTIMDFTEAVADGVVGEFERLKEFGIKGSKQDGEVFLNFRGQQFKAAATKDGEIDAKGVEKQLRNISEKFFSGAMARKAATFGGAIAEFQDTVEMAAFRLWRSGLDKPITKFIRNISATLSDPKTTQLIEGFGKKIGTTLQHYLPVIEKFMKNFIANLPGYLKKISEYLEKAKSLLPVVAKGFMILAVSLATMKALGVGFAIAGMITKLILLRSAFKLLMPVLLPLVKGAGLFPLLVKWLGRMLISGLAVSGVVIAIGSAIAALGYLGYRLYLYFTQGSKSLDDLRASMPWLAGSIERTGEYLKAWWPHLKVAWLMIKEGLIGETNSLAAVVKWAFFKVIVPAVQMAVEVMTTLGDWVRVAYETYMPALVTSFYYFKDGWREVWEFMQPGLK